MTAGRIVGLVLVIVGIVVLLWGGIFWTRNKTVVDAGPIDIRTQQHEGVALPPIVGVGSLVVGIVLLVVGGRQRV
jgi:uncharacterized membrane protein YidH (DUF202 family)